jgi:branched-chain amino acid transport system permease protein
MNVLSLDLSLVLNYLIDAVRQGSLYALIALGLAVVFGMLRLVNFAHADFVTIGAYALYVALAVLTLPFALALVVLLAVLVLVSLLIERAAFRPARRADPTTLLVMSFALSYLIQNLEILVFGGRAKSVRLPAFFSGQVHMGPVDLPNLGLLTIGVTLALLGALVLFLNRTSLGLQMSAASEDFAMAQLVGVRANGVIAAAFAISGVFAAAVSLILVSQVGSLSPTMATLPVLVGFAAVVVGGLGSLTGATLGGFFLGFASTAFQAWLPLDLRPFRDAFLFLLVIGFLLVRPQGIVAGRTPTDRI